MSLYDEIKSPFDSVFTYLKLLKLYCKSNDVDSFYNNLVGRGKSTDSTKNEYMPYFDMYIKDYFYQDFFKKTKLEEIKMCGRATYL